MYANNLGNGFAIQCVLKSSYNVFWISIEKDKTINKLNNLLSFFHGNKESKDAIVKIISILAKKIILVSDFWFSFKY